MTVKKLALAALSALTLTFGAAGMAHAETYLSDWSPDDMKSILVDAGAKVTDSGVDDGKPFIKAETAKGLKFTVFGAACDVGPTNRCRGAELSTSYTLDNDAAVEAKIKSLDFVAVTIMNDGDNTLNVHRYLIFDHGIARENVQTNIEVFIQITEKIWDGL